MFLAGTFELTIDAKNRLSIPFQVTRKLNPDRDGQSFYLLPGRRRGTLALFPEKYYEELRGNVPPDDRLSDDAYAFRQFEFSQSALLITDAQGRVVIPERVLKRAGIDREVVLIGVRDHLELWRKADFEAFESAMWPEYTDRRTQAVHEMHALAAVGGATPPTPAAGAQAERGA